MNGTGRIAKNVIFNWSGMGVALVLGFIQAPIVVSSLGNVWYGVWALINQITGYAWLFDLGIREAVIRYVSKHNSKKEVSTINEVITGAVYLYFFISILTMLVVSGFVIVMPYLFKLNPGIVQTARAVLLINGLCLAINWFFNAYVGVLMGLQRFDIFQKIGMVTGVVNFVLVITFLKMGHGILALSLIGLGVAMVSNALVYIQCRRLLPDLKLLGFRREVMQFKEMINYGKYVFLNNISSKVVYGTDFLIIGIFLPVSAITLYAIPSLLINYMRQLITTATWVLNPVVSELESRNDMGRVKSTLVFGTKFSFLVGLPIGLVYLIMGKNFISLWMGMEYGETTEQVLLILTTGTLAGLVHHTMNSVLYGLSRHKIIAYTRVAEAVTNISLSLIFIQTLGIAGVALGMAASHVIFMSVLLPVLVCRSLSFRVGQYIKEAIIPPILSSIPFAVCCYLVNRLFPSHNLVGFFLWIAVILPVFMVSAWFIALSKGQRSGCLSMMYSYIPCLKEIRNRIFERS